MATSLPSSKSLVRKNNLEFTLNAASPGNVPDTMTAYISPATLSYAAVTSFLLRMSSMSGGKGTPLTSPVSRFDCRSCCRLTLSDWNVGAALTGAREDGPGASPDPQAHVKEAPPQGTQEE